MICLRDTELTARLETITAVMQGSKNKGRDKNVHLWHLWTEDDRRCVDDVFSKQARILREVASAYIKNGLNLLTSG